MSSARAVKDLLRLAGDPPALLQAIRERPTLMLLLANLTAQGMTVAVSPVLSRIYSPDAFGTFGLVSALILVCNPLATGRYELGLMRAASPREARALLALCMVVIASMTPLLGALVFAAVRALPIAQSRGLAEVWYFVPLGLVAIALYDTLAIEASRQGRLQPLAASKLAQACFGVTAQIGLGLLRVGVAGLLVGFIITQAAGLTRLWSALVRRDSRAAPLRWAELRAAAFAHRRLPLYSGWSSALDQAAKWGLQIAIPLLWQPAIGGYIFLSDRIVGRPLQLLSTSLLPVYVADVTRAMQGDRQRIPAIYRSALRKQASICVVWTVLVLLIAPFIMGPLFGPAWQAAVPYVQTISLAGAPTAALHGVWHTLQLAGYARLDSLLTVLRVTAVVSLVAYCSSHGVSALDTLKTFAVVQACFALAVYVSHQAALRELTRAPRGGHAADS